MHQTFLILILLCTCISEAAAMTGRRTRHYDHTNAGINDNVYHISQDNDGVIWFSTYGGLYSYDGNKFVCHKDSLPVPPRRGQRWQPATDLERQIAARRQAADKDRIFCSLYDKDGNLWMGSTDGLWLYGNAHETFRFINIGEEVLCLYLDRAQRLWMTTRDGMVAMLGPDLMPVRYLSADGVWKREKARCGFVVTDIREDERGNVWMAARRSGLIRLTPRSGGQDAYTIVRYRNTATPNTLDNVYALCFDSRQRLWTASLDTGLGFVECKAGSHDTGNAIVNCTAMAAGRGATALRQRFRCFLPVSHDTWLAGSDKGLFSISPLTWDRTTVGTWSEVAVAGKRLKQAKPLSVQHLIAADNGTIYGATAGNGLLEASLTPHNTLSQNAALLTMQDGWLPSDVIYTMVRSRNGDVWGFTDNGLFRIPAQRRRQQTASLPRTIACFLAGDMSPWPQTTIGNAVALPDGRIVKGMRDGLLSFNADSMTAQTAEHRVYLRVRYRHGDNACDLRVADTLHLPPGVSRCTFYIAPADYNRLSEPRYAVMSDRSGGKWRYVAADTFLLEDIADGQTTLSIRHTDSAGAWTDKGRDIVIVAQRSATMPWMAVATAAAMVAATATAAVVWRRRRKKRRNGLTVENIKALTDAIPTSEEQERRLRQRIEQAVLKAIADAGYNTDMLARDVCLTKTSLLATVKTLYGMTPNELINRIRIQAAEELLRQTSATVSEIAYRTGFNDPKYFSRVYKKFTGRTPSETRNEERQ